MNYKHLFYFWNVARHGGILRASEAIHISPQTLSGQIKLLEESLGTPLFRQRGRRLELTEAGDVAREYADEMFSLGAELEQVIRSYPRGRPVEFRVGVSDALPKSVAYRLLRPAISLDKEVRIVCREWRLDRLLNELGQHRLDLVISDAPTHAAVDAKPYAQRLGRSTVVFLAHPELAKRGSGDFPERLQDIPLLFPGEDSALRNAIDRWVKRRNLRLYTAGIFDDMALMAAFGREKIGAFPIPATLVDEFTADGQLVVLGQADGVYVDYYALSVERKTRHPCVAAITAAARDSLEPT
ncbi:transcriptional activator NhaR [uncultured Propionivibrio sp.]|uniref:transcriptional activator NhaR n=1 Tax=uncultured Propionivibrio sp. TaxID=426737 RepID=UPI0029C04054|nr:transcriptional activator NhaR [uncultured Propionivibrio sp.]